ncbi:MAG TPA: site-specific DNA-methyltransferase [Candidatus Baltobacteraceae bacterium]|nr:site-specific DNA-methyltransferase [Candidatus Baltobacteraceae bacterium]
MEPRSRVRTELIWDGKYGNGGLRAQGSITQTARSLTCLEQIGDRPSGNMLIRADNKDAATMLLQQYRGAVRLVYIDPPFDTKRDFVVYRDRWGRGADSYLQMLYERLVPIRELLTPDGSIFVHCDWRVSHWVRCLLDEVFGAQHFRNHIVWAYGQSARGAKAIARQFARNHDDIWCYSKNGGAHFHGATRSRRYSIEQARRAGLRQDADGRWYKTAPRGDYTQASIERLAAQGRILRTKTGSVRIKYFLSVEDGSIVESVPVGDVWTDIPDAMHLKDAEQTGYATQKPEALLRRIIESSTSAGDLVADVFCGSGTTLAVAEQLNRNWIGVDQSEAAIATARVRLLKARSAFAVYTLT